MNTIDFAIQIGPSLLELCPEKALFLPAEAALIISDLHFGKAAHFRKHGVPLPQQPDHENLERLSHLMHRKAPRRIIFSGDAFHSEANSGLSLFTEWRKLYPEVEMTLVRGNHDVLPAKAYLQLGLELVAHSLQLGHLHIVHKPEDAVLTNPLHYALAGHLHPGITLQGAGRQSLRLPCFWQGAQVGVMPAFGSFTGLFTVEPQPGDTVYAFANERVIQIPVATAGTAALRTSK